MSSALSHRSSALFCRAAVWLLLALLTGCSARAPWRQEPVLPAEVAAPAVRARVLEPESPAPPDPVAQQAFSLRQAIEHALQYNPRLRGTRAALERARGQEQAAFAPFLPQIDFLSHYGATSPALGPASAGPTGIILATGQGTHAFAQAELQLQWIVCDFGRRRGHLGQAVAREQIAALQAERANETVAFDVASAYMQALEAKALRLTQEEAIRRARATLHDTRARRAAGVAEKDDVLRGEVQLAEALDGLEVAAEQEYTALARLNNFMGRHAGLPLELADCGGAPDFDQTLLRCLEIAAEQRREIRVAQQAVAAAQHGRAAASAEFLPRVYALNSAGAIGGAEIRQGTQLGAGLHIDMPLYSGGKHKGELRAAEADIEESLAGAQVILDGVTLEVALAHRHVMTAQQRIAHLRPAVAEARENLRLVGNRYRNGSATPTDIVDAETALTRAQQRLASVTYQYLAALARLDYALGNPQGSSLAGVACGAAAETPQLLPPRPLPGPE